MREWGRSSAAAPALPYPDGPVQGPLDPWRGVVKGAMGWLVASHVFNVVVAGIVGTLLLSGSRRMTSVYGADAPARRILACLYVAIAASSAWALLDAERLVVTAQVLFPLQIFYKLATVYAVKDRRNPVPWWNFGISVLHAIALTKT